MIDEVANAAGESYELDFFKIVKRMVGGHDCKVVHVEGFETEGGCKNLCHEHACFIDFLIFDFITDFKVDVVFCAKFSEMVGNVKDFAGGIKLDKASADIEASGIYRTVFFEYRDVGSTAADIAVGGYNMLFDGHCGSTCAASCDNAFKVVTCGCNNEVACHAGHEVKNGSCVLFSCGFTGDDYCAGVDIFGSEPCCCIFAYDNVMYRVFIDGSFIDKRSGVDFAFVNNFLVGDLDSRDHVFAGSVFDCESAENYLCCGSTDINTCAEYFLFHTSYLL